MSKKQLNNSKEKKQKDLAPIKTKVPKKENLNENENGKATFREKEAPKLSLSQKMHDRFAEASEKIRKKYSNFKTRTKKKTRKFLSDLKKSVFQTEIYVKGGKQPPTSYSFERKFYGLYAIFLFYSFIFIWAINDPTNIVIYILTFGNPFMFANAVLVFFLILSVLFSVNKIRDFVFKENTHIKQPIFYGSIILMLYLIFSLVNTEDLDFTTYLLFFSMIWLFLLSSRFFSYARKFSTKIEARFISRYSILRYLIVLMVPFFVLGVLVFISFIYRGVLVFLALDFLGPNSPENAVIVYNIEMRLVMPLIYFGLVMTMVFIIFEFVFTRRRGETKRAGSFDNFTFSLIVLFIFFFQLFQVTIFLIMRPETITALKQTVGATSNTVTYIFLIEFAISMFFLYRIITKLGGSFGWRFFFFKKDGLILFLLACVFAQTISRYALSTQVSSQGLSIIGNIMSFDRYIVSILMILFLGITLLIYYLKPHETSMFMRMQKELVNEEEKSMDIVYDIIKSEYIRRGEPYPLDIIERELIKATQLSKGLVYSLIKRLAEKDMNISLTESRDKSGNIIRTINFLSITEQFEKKEVADEKAKKFMSKRLADTVAQDERKTMHLAKDMHGEKATDQLLSSLASDYKKRQEEHDEIEQKQEAGKLAFKKIRLTTDLKNIILEVIKKEYNYRVENREEYPDFYIPISQISNQIELATKISPGELYPILEEVQRKDLEFKLISNPKEPQDKRIKIFPIADDNLVFSLANFRPKEYSEVRVFVVKNLISAMKDKKTNTIIATLKRTISTQKEKPKAWFELLSILFDYYPVYDMDLKYIPDRMKLIKMLENYALVFDKRIKTKTPKKEEEQKPTTANKQPVSTSTTTKEQKEDKKNKK